MAWVERGDAPNALIASHSTAARPPAEIQALPVESADRTRPVFPYPLTARYSGTGSIDKAENFVVGEPSPVPAALLNWLDEGFYTAHYEQWCVGNGAAIKCISQAGQNPLGLEPDRMTLSVNNLETTRDWYQNTLGFSIFNHFVRDKDFEIYQMSVSGYRIDLIHAAGSQRPPKPSSIYLQQGWVHIAFHVPDVATTYSTLQARKTDVIAIKTQDQKINHLILHDCEGNEIEIFQRAPPQQ